MSAGAALVLTAHAGPYRIVTGDESNVTRRIADDLAPRLAALFANAPAQRRTLCIAIGPVALRRMVEGAEECTLLSAYTSSPVWRTLISTVPAARAASMSAVYAEPAPADQLRLVALLYRRPVRIAAIVGADTGFLIPALRDAADVFPFEAGGDINRVLNRIGQAEVLLATPDSSVYNTENIRNILLSTYRHNQAVIGFSADMVRAGALASTYSDIGDINAQIADMASAYLASGALEAPQFPRYFNTIVNDGVARSLNVVPDSAALKFGRRPPRQP